MKTKRLFHFFSIPAFVFTRNIGNPEFMDCRMKNGLKGFYLEKGSTAIVRGLRIGRYHTDILGNNIALVPDIGAIAAMPQQFSNTNYPDSGDEENTLTSENACWQYSLKIQNSQL